jgi:hypothetical protein
VDPKIWKRPKTLLLSGAVALALASAALGRPRVAAGEAVSATPPPTIEAFDVARLLSAAPPDTVVVTLGDGRHPLFGATPITLFGDGEDAQIQGAPKARRIVLVGGDAITTDRVARRLMATGRNVSVLSGGREAWDRAMDADPKAPPASASAEDRARYLRDVALRRYFGDEAAAPKSVVVAPVAAPKLAPAPRAKKREGC